MKVVCTNNNLNKFDSRLSEFAFYQDKEGKVDLSIDKEYIVYGIRENDLGKFYLVLTDEYSPYTPWWMPAGFFKVTDKHIPESWKVHNWKGSFGDEQLLASSIYFGAQQEVEDSTEKGSSIFQEMKKEAETTN